MAFDFDTEIPLRGTHSQKYDAMARFTDCKAADGLPMWVADMDFRPPQAVLDVMRAEVDRGVFGYFGDDSTVRAAIRDWLADRHGWTVEPEWIHFSRGVVEGVAFCLEAFTEPGDGVIVFSPVYHAFYRKIRAKGRVAVESRLDVVNGRFEMDLDALAGQLDGREKMVVLCSPHNPGGRLWSGDELRALAEFCEAFDLVLVSDEIHMDLTFPGARHIPTAIAAPQALPRLVVLSAASKGFNVAGSETGFVITPDESLRQRIAAAHAADGGSPNRFGMRILEACFAGGGDWSDALRGYLAENFRLFRDGVNAIPGLACMDMDATYLTWVDFAGTGMERAEFRRRIAEDARIGASPGTAFGAGGETHMRFNVATRRANVVEAVERLQSAFADLQ